MKNTVGMILLLAALAGVGFLLYRTQQISNKEAVANEVLRRGVEKAREYKAPKPTHGDLFTGRPPK